MSNSGDFQEYRDNIEEKPEETPEEKPEEKPEEDENTVTGTISCGTAKLRIRVAPNGDLTGDYLITGNKVMILEQKTVGATVWARISKGWISMNYVNTAGSTDNTPENVQKAFEYAKNYVDNHPELPAPLITINSWNEWTETSYLQPDDLYGYGYLEAIKKVFCE